MNVLIFLRRHLVANTSTAPRRLHICVYLRLNLFLSQKTLRTYLS